MLRFFECSYDPGRHMPLHEDRVSRISIVVRGTLWEAARGCEEVGSATSIVVKPSGVPHETKFGPEGARVLSIFADEPELFDQWRWIHRGPAIEAAVRFIAAKADLPGAGTTTIEERAWQLLGALRADRGRQIGPAVPPRWLRRIHEQLHEDMECPHTVSALALHAGVHPVHLTRTFRRYYQSTITGYRSQIRVRAAAHILATSDEPIAAVAPACGFSDQSHLCRVFKRATGLSPGRFRIAAREV